MTKNNILKNHPYFFILTPIILLKFFLVRSLLFEGTSLLQTIWLELSYLLILFSLVELLSFQKTKKILYLTLNFIVSTMLLAVLLYHSYFDYIVTFDALSLIGQVGTVKDSVFQLMKPFYFLLFVDFPFFIGYAIYKRNKKESNTNLPNKKFLVTILVVGIVITGLNVFSQKDVKIANTVLAAEKQGILTYELIAFTNKVSAGSNRLTPNEIAELPETIRELKEIEIIPQENRRLFGIAKDKNIIAIQVEALQDFAINLKVDDQEVTPFLNSLVSESLYFTNIYQQIGPGNTSDAEFLFNTSIYPRAYTPTTEVHGDQEIPSLPKLLKEDGYTTFTQHANNITFWNRNNLYAALGFDNYYDVKTFGQDDIIGIGPSDEVLFQKSLMKIRNLHEKNEKFYAHFVTLSSHHPFFIPDTKKVISLPEQFNGMMLGEYLKSINYTDQAIEQFVNELKEEGIWEDTVLVIYGDHSGVTISGSTVDELSLVSKLVGHPYTYLDQFNVPFIISIGGQNIAEVNETVGGQIDMMPTLANLLSLSLEEHVHFGQDLINYPNNLIGMRYYMPIGSFFNNEVTFKPAEGFEDGEAYDIYTFDPIDDFLHYKYDYQRISQLLVLSDRYLNSMPYR